MISTRGRYALRMMLDLAEHRNDGYVALKDIAQRQSISKKYLEQIIPQMNRAGFLQTVRGSQGGYRLNREPKDYTVKDIISVTEGNLATVACLEGEVNLCPRCAECATVFVWEGLQKVMNEYLDSITLQDILDKKHSMPGNDYNI